MTTAIKLDGRNLVTCHEAAKIYGCSMRYMRRLASTGRVYSQTLGRTYLVDRDEVQKLAKDAGYMSRGFAAN